MSPMLAIGCPRTVSARATTKLQVGGPTTSVLSWKGTDEGAGVDMTGESNTNNVVTSETAVRTTDLGIDGLSGAVHLGAGGSANVFAARKLDTGEQVAVKLLRASADSDKERTRFIREQDTLRILAARDGIVPVLDAGLTDREEPYFLMPLMAGSLQDRIDNDGPLDWQTATQLMVEVADTVDYAHANSVLHRDLKPGNILLDDGGVPRVADFGIAKLLDSSVSKSSKSLGTPSFMPPERFNGQEATAASDVYGLAATLAALITGTAPFLTGENDTDAAVMMRVISEAPPSLDGLNVPVEVRDVVQAAMAKDPSERPQSASEFAGLLRAALDPHVDQALSGPVTVAIPRRNITIPDGPVTSPKGATLEVGADQPKDEPNRKVLVFLAAALFAVLVGGGAALALTGGDKPETEVAGDVETRDQDGTDAAATSGDSKPSEDATNDEANIEGALVDDETGDASDTEGTVDDSDDDTGTSVDADGEVPSGGDGDGNTTAAAETSGDTNTANKTTTDTGGNTNTTTGNGGDTGEEKVESGDGGDNGGTVVETTPPHACFRPSSTAVKTGVTVSFTNCSTDADSYTWDLDPGSSSSASASTSWTTAGVKTVWLTARGSGLSDRYSANITVTENTPPPAAPVACFSVNPSTVETGHSVTFSNCSTDATSYKWSFGDGGTSTHTSPTKSWATAGSKTVTLTATGPGGTDTETKWVMVQELTPEPEACFTASATTIEPGHSVSFTNCSKNATSYSWTFGDGGTSTHTSPSHTFSHEGTYTVRLTANGAGGSDSATRTITVKKVTAPGPDAEDRWVTLASDETSTSSDLTKGTAVNARVLGDSAGSYDYTLTWEGIFSHTRQSDAAYSFWIDYEVLDAHGASGSPGRIHLNVEAKSTDNAPEDRSKTITMSATQDQIDVNLLAAGGNSARWLGGDDKHALYGNGRYLYAREGAGADTHRFQFYELLNQKIIVRWTVTVIVEAKS